ncbi:GGDEF domain-containing protein [Dactylosporangium sp. CA-139066]|uniref:GGDEF domain-containing protein n=1 Tax=Dactylosporangium sp. CA-139066 TaxID=3239930 RepID=UPI003D8F7709
MNHGTVGLLAAVVEALQVAAFTWWWCRLVHTLGTDDLTGLRNRHGLHDALRDLWTTPGLLLLDLTGFKAVNDQCGHDTGDAMLRGVAAQLTKIAPRGAVVGRLGGDEFVLLLPDATTRDHLIEAAIAVRAAVGRARPVPARDGATSDRPAPVVSCIVGLALPGALPDPDKPFRAADIALYHARHHGLPYALYQPGMTHPAAAERHGHRLRDHTAGTVPTGRTTFTALIADLRAAAALAASGALDSQQTTAALTAAGDLVTRLDLRAFEVSTGVGSDDLRELVVITVHGVDLEIRGRYGPHGGPEIYVHVDDRRPDEEITAMPLVVEIYPS